MGSVKWNYYIIFKIQLLTNYLGVYDSYIDVLVMYVGTSVLDL